MDLFSKRQALFIKTKRTVLSQQHNSYRTMAQIYDILKPQSIYFDRKYYQNLEDYQKAIATSTTVYVGNLSFFTTQDSIHELFSMAGNLAQIIMGIDDVGNPNGFCFAVFQTQEGASNAVQFISKTKLDQRIIRVDWDAGYQVGREKGRGTGGQQRRDDFRTKEDPERPRKIPHFEQRDKQRSHRTQGEQDRERTRQKKDYRRQKEEDRSRSKQRRQERYTRQQPQRDMMEVEQKVEPKEQINEIDY